MPTLPLAVKSLALSDVLIYSAKFRPFFNAEKGRVDKGFAGTIAHKSLKGHYDENGLGEEEDGYTGYMMRCGSRPYGGGYVVLDFDVKGEQKVSEVFADFLEAIKDTGPVAVATPSGGVHLYYKLPESMTWTKELNIDEIDIGGKVIKTHGKLDIIANGGGILLPGSHYAFKGENFTYQYANEGDDITHAPLLPQLLIDAFNKREIMTGVKSKPASALVATALETAPTAPTAPRSTTPSRGGDENTVLLTALCACLTPEWLDDYTNWRNLVFCLKSISTGTLQLALDTCRRATRYRPEWDAKTKKLWAEAQCPGRIGFASLNYWARRCSPEKHHDAHKEDYGQQIYNGNAGYASIFATELAGDCVYDKPEGLFWLWLEHKQLWKPVDEDNITARFMDIMPRVMKRLRSSMKKPTEEESPEGIKWKLLLKLQQSFSNSMPEPVMKCIRDSLNPLVSFRNIDTFELDKNPDFLPLANGVWNFKENRLEEYTRQHYISRRLDNITYNPNANQAPIKEAMRLWFKGNQEVIDFVQYWLGYTLTGYLSRQDFLIVFGTSAGNGKTTLFEQILQQDILGSEFATSMGEDALTKVGGNNDDIYYSFGKRLAISAEAGNTGKTQEINLNALKRITGDGIIAAEAKFKGKKSSAFTAKVVFICNEMPNMPQDNGVRRRTNVLEMNVKFVRQEEWAELTDEEQRSGDYGVRRPEFISELRANKEGILAWLLEGASAYMANPERMAPEAIRRYTAEALANACPVRKWFMEGYKHDKKSKEEMAFKDIADKWAEHFGIKATNMSARGKFLRIVREMVGASYVTGNSNHGYQVMGLSER